MVVVIVVVDYDSSVLLFVFLFFSVFTLGAHRDSLSLTRSLVLSTEFSHFAFSLSFSTYRSIVPAQIKAHSRLRIGTTNQISSVYHVVLCVCLCVGVDARVC